LSPLSTEQATALFDKLKEEHDFFAKAVKSDDAKVPVHIWDEGVLGRAPNEEEKRALTLMRGIWLRVYRRQLGRDVRNHLTVKFGKDWAQRSGGQNHGLLIELEAMRDTMWRAADNDWFEYPMSSSLLHFRFPKRYQSQALEGVRMMFTAEGPTEMKSQPPLKNDICIDEKLGVVVMTSQEKWDRMKSICSFWLEQLDQGMSELGYKRLLSDRGFMVYVTQAYPGMKPYLKGFHLSLETWRGGRDEEGWKMTPKEAEQEAARAKERKRDRETKENHSNTSTMDDIKMDLLTQASTSRVETGHGPPGGFTGGP